MKNILKISIIFGVIFAVYFSFSLLQKKNTRGINEVEESEITVEKNEESEKFNSGIYRFEYPKTWNPEYLEGDEDVLNLGMPYDGILEQTLSIKEGSVEEERALAKSNPKVIAIGYVGKSLIRSMFDEESYIENFQIIGPGENEGEVIVVNVKVDRDELLTSEHEGLLIDLYKTLAIVRL